MSTRATLRRSLAKRTRQPFFRRLGVVNGTATGGSTTTLIDTAVLLQADDFWKGQFVYLVSSGEVREISAHSQSTKTLTWLEPVAGAVQSNDVYEIWSTWTPVEIHDALNQALRDAWPFLFMTVEEYLVIQQDIGVSYSLSGLTYTPRRVAQVLLEAVDVSSLTGTSVASPGAQDYLKDTNQTFTSEHVGWEVRIYEGTSAGDRRTVSALVDSNTLQVSSNFTSTLDATSKFRLVDVIEHQYQYTQVLDWSVDNQSRPTMLRLASHPSGLEGLLLRLVTEAEYPDMSSDTSSTTAPDEYVELTALARLYLQALSNRPESELQAWAAMQSTYAEAAQQFVLRHQMRHAPGQITDDQWPRRVNAEYPFVE